MKKLRTYLSRQINPWISYTVILVSFIVAFASMSIAFCNVVDTLDLQELGQSMHSCFDYIF